MLFLFRFGNSAEGGDWYWRLPCSAMAFSTRESSSRLVGRPGPPRQGDTRQWVTCSVLGCQCSIPVFLPLQVHEEEDALNVWMYDAVENNGKYTRWQALGQLTTALALLAGLYGLSVLYDAPSRNPAVSRATVQQGRGTLQHGAGHLAARGGAPCSTGRGTLQHGAGHLAARGGAPCSTGRGTLPSLVLLPLLCAGTERVPL